MRVNRQVKALAEQHWATMSKCGTFKEWAKRHLRVKAKSEYFEEAFNYVKGARDGAQAVELGQRRESSNIPPLRPNDE
jgi:hypothetical protein